MKSCPRCKSNNADFGPNKARTDGLQTYCRACMKNLRLERGYDKVRWQTSREFESARNREYRKAHAERIKAADCARATRRRQENPAAIRSQNIARKHGMRQATPAWADHAAMNAIYAKAKAMEAADGIERHVDHRVPLKHPLVCGLHVPANLQILTAAENMSKHNTFEVA